MELFTYLFIFGCHSTVTLTISDLCINNSKRIEKGAISHWFGVFAYKPLGIVSSLPQASRLSSMFCAWLLPCLEALSSANTCANPSGFNCLSSDGCSSLCNRSRCHFSDSLESSVSGKFRALYRKSISVKRGSLNGQSCFERVAGFVWRMVSMSWRSEGEKKPPE